VGSLARLSMMTGLNTDKPIATRLTEIAKTRGFDALVKPGRFREESNVELLTGNRLIAVVKVFEGRPPYHPWLEVFNIDPAVTRTELELALLRSVAEAAPCGATVYVEYVQDRETRTELAKGVDPSSTRLGRLLGSLGLRVVRDWYYPEGWLEGSPKLQSEKTC